MRPPIATRLQRGDLRRSPIRAIMELADRENIINLGLDPDEVVSFAGGWVNHRAPEGLREEYLAIAADPELFHDVGAYSPTRGLPELRQMLVRFDRQIYGTGGLREEHLVIGQSSTQLTYCLLLALLDPGDRVLLFDPTYANYPAQLALCHGGIGSLTLPVFDAETWALFEDEGAVLSSLAEILERERPKLLLFSSPDNPTGRLVPDRAFFTILEMAAEAGCFVAVDYAYRAQYFLERPPEHFSASPEEHPNLVKLHSNSKWCRGLGRRLGWVEASPEVADALEIVQQGVILCPDTAHQLALARYLERSLENGSLESYLEESRQAYAGAARFMGRCIEKHLGMRYTDPQGGLYTVVDVGMDGDRFVRDVLEHTGVVFVPGYGFGRSLQDAVRVSFGPLVDDLPKMEEGFSRVRDHLRRSAAG